MTHVNKITPPPTTPRPPKKKKKNEVEDDVVATFGYICILNKVKDRKIKPCNQQ